jgi:hypothetical protein
MTCARALRGQRNHARRTSVPAACGRSGRRLHHKPELSSTRAGWDRSIVSIPARSSGTATQPAVARLRNVFRYSSRLRARSSEQHQSFPVHALDLAARPELLDHPAVNFRHVHLSAPFVLAASVAAALSGDISDLTGELSAWSKRRRRRLPRLGWRSGSVTCAGLRPHLRRDHVEPRLRRDNRQPGCAVHQ